MGIVGLGRIGVAVGRRLRAFSIGRILYTSRTPKREEKELDAKKVDLDELLKESDVVIACCALSKETAGMFNSSCFEKMKRTSTFINTSRSFSSFSSFSSSSFYFPIFMLHPLQ